ncbi:MAG TPA: hypothetical protein ENN80_10225 [Candidatus Hydrogenedentes bacterium]|nr:hypothetical protein [Candidatus Hydrogenedentota bacterium]
MCALRGNGSRWCRCDVPRLCRAHPGIAQRLRASYPGTFDRLVEIKRQYDPDNFFRLNLNIPPGGE